MDSQNTIRKNPIVIVLNFLFLEIIALIIYRIMAISADYGEIYRSIFLAEVVPFNLAILIFQALVEVILITIPFLWWSFESFEIYPNMITHEWGVIFKKREVIPLDYPVSVTYSQGPFSRLMRYGTIKIQNKDSAKPIILKNFPNPEKYAGLIAKIRIKAAPVNLIGNSNVANVKNLLTRGESDKLEYKMSLRWDVHGNRVNKNLERSIIKTVAALLNSEGGHLIIGVDDNGKPVGLEKDYLTLGKPNADGLENHFSNLFNAMIGAEFRRFIRLQFKRIEGKEICAISVQPSPKPVYVRSENGEEFYIRTGNSTTALEVSKVATYVSSWWGDQRNE